MGQTLYPMAREQSKDELLYQAAVVGNVGAVKVLVREGARFEWFDQEGKTALIAACLSPELYDVANTLIELGANVNAYCPRRNAGTPLHHAAKRGSGEIVKLLLSHGANALVLNNDGQTPVDVARSNGFTNVVRLIKHHISYFTGWLREFRGPGFLGALAPQWRSNRIWVNVAPCGPVSPSNPNKLEIAIYDTLQDTRPRAVINIWNSQIEEPKFSQQDLILRILDKFTGIRYKLGPAVDGDKQQILSFYNACLGICQAIPSIVDPSSMPSVSTSQSLQDTELAMATHVSMQTATGSYVVSATNGWEDMPNNAAYNGWGSSDPPNEPGTSSNGWADQPADSSSNGRGGVATKPIPTHKNAPPVPKMNNEIPPTVSVNPTAPPLHNGFDKGSIHYPGIDNTPVEVLNATTAEGATSVKTHGNDGRRSSCCSICLEAPVEGACIPCGHMAGCMSCLSEIKSKKGDCPVCRAKINEIIRLYVV